MALTAMIKTFLSFTAFSTSKTAIAEKTANTAGKTTVLIKNNNPINPANEVSSGIKQKCDDTILAYERMMSEFSFDKIFELLNIFLRDANKDWSVRSKSDDPAVINQLLADTFHIIRVSAALFHPLVPAGCEIIREYLGVDERIWDWDYIFEPLDFFISSGHEFKFLEPRVDFFHKHPTQIG